MKNLIVILCVSLFGLLVHAVPTALTVVTLSEASQEPALAADFANGNSAVNPDGKLMLMFQNTHATDAITVTVVAQKTAVTIPGLGPVAKSSITCALAASEICFVGPLNSTVWNDTAGKVQVTYTGTGTPLALAFKRKDF